jgi:hypothetical protein
MDRLKQDVSEITKLVKDWGEKSVYIPADHRQPDEGQKGNQGVGGGGGKTGKEASCAVVGWMRESFAAGVTHLTNRGGAGSLVNRPNGMGSLADSHGHPIVAIMAD